jgi:hypothetical protein
MTALFRSTLLALVALLAACENAPAPSSSSSRHAAASQAPGSISLERTAGLLPEGPRYVVTLFQDGLVVFEGYADVPHKGTQTKHIAPDRARALFTRLDAINFWERNPRYTEERATTGADDKILRVAPEGAPMDIMTARYQGRFKRIDGLFFAPTELLDFKRAIEETVGLDDWLGVIAGTR